MVRNQGDDPILRLKSVFLVLVMVLTMLLVGSPSPTQAQFITASWEYPDEYGQGIDGMRFYENSTGSWVAAPYYTDIGKFYYLNSYESGYTLNWSVGASMKLRVHTMFNSTLTGAIDEADGQNYQRHSVIVTLVGETIFSQQDFTYYDVESIGGIPEWLYKYEVVLDFVPLAGAIYTVVVTYETLY